MKKFNKQINFDFSDSQFEDNKEDERNRLRQGNIYHFNKDINNLSLDAEELDRVDDFKSLKIPLDSYEKKEGSNYGIEFNEAVHKTDNVILPHQKAAAEIFLKSLRGFGLLADVVGSGKTYEAGVVLSELSARGKVKSLLIIVPDHLIKTWKDVLENKFGMGKDSIYISNGTLRNVNKDNFNRPLKPILISYDDFAGWDLSYADLLFDVIVVDEAHNLCKDDSKYSSSLYMLSKLMETKKKYGNNYCLLLSATPHTGDLDKMFNLWYFIRCKGGRPTDFKQSKNIEHTQEFLAEKKYYHEVVCKNSNTVMEFIKHVKISEIENREEYRELFKEYLRDVEGITYEQYNNLDISKDALLDAKIVYIDNFLNSEIQKKSDLKLKDKLFTTIANAYHNSVLRSIMVRQSKSAIKSSNRIISKNIYYYPNNKKHEDDIFVYDLSHNKIKIHLNDMYKYTANGISHSSFIDNPEYPDSRMTIQEYCNQYRPDGYEMREAIADLTIKILRENLCDDEDKISFSKRNILAFINEAIRTTDLNLKNFFKPYYYDPNDKSNFDHKFYDLFKIFDCHSNNKVVIFFDYETILTIPDYMEKFKNKLINSPYKDRVVFSKNLNNENIQEIYDNNENLILVCEDETLTEGINLQTGNVVVNFSITPDPVAMNQRIGRLDRLGQANAIYIYSLADINKLEGVGLAYLSSIGIMNSSNDDATIISGSSNEKMIAIHCPVCERVKMIQKEKYELFLKNPDIDKQIRAGILCGCKNSVEIKYKGSNYTLMKDFNLNNSKCDNCGSVFYRTTKNDSDSDSKSSGSRFCFANVKDKMILESAIGNSYEYYCSKLCAMRHCKTFKSQNPNCKVLERIQQNMNITDIMSFDYCGSCDNPCDPKCRPYDDGLNMIGIKESCLNCANKEPCGPINGKKYIEPHVLTFNKDWVAKCPYCHTGYLKPVVNSTFDKFIRSSWRFNGDNGESFVSMMLDELERVIDIKTILERDEDSNE